MSAANNRCFMKHLTQIAATRPKIPHGTRQVAAGIARRFHHRRDVFAADQRPGAQHGDGSDRGVHGEALPYLRGGPRAGVETARHIQADDEEERDDHEREDLLRRREHVGAGEIQDDQDAEQRQCPPHVGHQAGEQLVDDAVEQHQLGRQAEDRRHHVAGEHGEDRQEPADGGFRMRAGPAAHRLRRGVGYRAAGALTTGGLARMAGPASPPFGGYNESGFGGRDKSRWAHDQSPRIKTIWIDAE